MRPGRDPAGGPAGRRGHAGRAAPPQRPDGRGHVRRRRRPSCRRCPASGASSAGAERAALRGPGTRRAADRRARPGTACAACTSREPSLEEIFLHHYDGSHDVPIAERCPARGRAPGGRRRAAVRRRARAPAPARYAGSAPDRSPTCSRSTPTSSRRATAPRTRRWRTGSRSPHSFAANKGLRLLYGEPHDVATVGRLHGVARRRDARDRRRRLRAARRGARRTRGEEEPGRLELVLAGPVGAAHASTSPRSPRSSPARLVLWVAELAGFARRRASRSAARPTWRSRPPRCVPVCVGVGALASQLAPTRRVALELGGGVVALLVPAAGRGRHRSAGSAGCAGRRPLGWAEELRPFTGAQAARAAAPGRCDPGAPGRAARIARQPRHRHRRAPRARHAPSRGCGLLRSPTAQALRGQRGALIAWARQRRPCSRFILGIGRQEHLAGRRLEEHAGRDRQARRRRRSRRRPATSRSCSSSSCSRSACSSAPRSAPPATRRPTSGSRRCSRCPVGRRRWLAGRLVLAALAAAGDLAARRAARPGRARPPAARTSRCPRCSRPAPTRCRSRSCSSGSPRWPTRAVPRAGSAITYRLVTVAFLWQLVGSLVGAPDVAARRHAVRPRRARAHPAVPHGRPPVVMVALGAIAALAGAAPFRRRDLIGG